jgi:lipooligosaccharide transport system permease protein
MTIGALRMVQRNALVYRREWRGTLFFSFLQPTLFLLAMGIGLGALVDEGDPSILGGLDYIQFLAPGLLAAACMQTASFESSFPITGKMTWQRNYEAISATPMRVVDIVLGELAWIAVRVGTVAVTFTAIMSLFGVPRSPLVVLAIPAAMLTGLAFSAVILGYAASVKNSKGFNFLFRFGITPLFLFSGVFFPISRLPLGLQTVAQFTPLFHGVELTRGLTLGTIDASAWILHTGYLAGMLTIGLSIARLAFRRRLET